MKLKHFAGYGNVEGKKLKPMNGEDLCIKIIGNHEWGIMRDADPCGIYSWLVKRFDKSVLEMPRLMQYTVDSWQMRNGIEECVYHIYYGGEC